jgi:iron complex outermembrane receptor protein
MRTWPAVLPLMLPLLATPQISVAATESDPSTQTESVAATPAADDAAEAETQSTAIGDIEVTAQRRVERLQDVPIAVTAFPTDQLESRGINDLGDLNALAPGLQISKTPSNNTISQITIRGSSQINPAIYWDPAVGVYVDGVYIGKAQGSIFDVVDLNRVEVLRGPQGTLYGRNTIGGTVNLVTRVPTGAFGGSASVDVGNYNSIRQRASLDLPRMGIVSLSFAAVTEQRDGWVDTTRLSSVPELNNQNSNGFRLAADFDFSPVLQGEYRYDRSRYNQTNNFDQLYRADPAFFGFVGYPDLPAYASHDRETEATVDAPSFERARIEGHSFTLSWDLGSVGTVKSITGYRRLDWNDSLDLDGSPMDVAFTQRFTDYDQYSQDLQYSGGTENLTYVGGIYYFADDGYTNNPQHFFNGGAEYDSQYGTKTSAWAGYGQVDYHLMDAWTFTAGLRYTHEKKSLERVFGCNAPASGCVPPDGEDFLYIMPKGSTEPDATFTDTTPMASIAYRINANANVYVRYAEGFKSGGFNGESADPNETTTPFKPEKQKSFELGAKTRLASGRVQLNAALFHNTLEELQESVFLGSDAAATVVRNAGEATVNGLELELAWMIVDGTQLRANYAYLDSEYDKFIDSGVDQSNNRAFVHTPESSFNIALDSELMRRDWGAIRAVVDYAWTDSFYTYAYQLAQPGDADYDGTKQSAPDTEVDAHGILNLRLALAEAPLGERATGEFSFWVRNALDDDTANNFIDFGPGFGSLTVANFEPPRMLGVGATIRW